jgi:uracil-DNA glycosylase family 4
MFSPMSHAEIIEALEAHIDLGCDDCLTEDAINRFLVIEPLRAATETPSAPITGFAEASTPAPRVFAEVPPPKANPKAPPTTEIDSAATLADLAEILRRFDGSALKKTAQNMVFSDGTPGSRVMLIGEAPGREEDRQGKPFVGPSGQLLDDMLALIGLDRSSVYICNLLPWRPPGDRAPNNEEVAQFMPFLRRHITLAQPQIIVTVGGSSTKALLESTDGITKLRGKWTSYTCSDGREIPVLPVFHPAFLLRTPARKAEMWRDLCAINARLEVHQ